MGYVPNCKIEPVSYSEPTPTSACQTGLDVALGLCAALPEREVAYCDRCHHFKPYKRFRARFEGSAGECAHPSNIKTVRHPISATNNMRYVESPECLNQDNDCKHFNYMCVPETCPPMKVTFPWVGFLAAIGVAASVAIGILSIIIVYLRR